MSTLPYDVSGGLIQYRDEGWTIGSIRESIAEASDANATGYPIVDGMSGDVRFPHGNMKPIVTMGERSVCNASNGMKVVGVPDGIGAYLPDDNTVRYINKTKVPVVQYLFLSLHLFNYLSTGPGCIPI